jgi:hypothetical protein
MAIELIDEFFDEDLTVDALYVHPTSGNKHIQVIIDAPYGATQAAGAEYQNTSPIAVCRTSDIPDALDTCTLIVDGVTYTVREVQPDGTGITRLILSKD